MKNENHVINLCLHFVQLNELLWRLLEVVLNSIYTSFM